MPVKVRCSGCQKVLNAPDKARGKAIKCPSCETPIRVPAGGRGGGGAQKKKKPARSARKPKQVDVLDRLDLDAAEDKSVQLCPKCGTEMYEDEVDCPECGFNLDSGRVKKKTKKEKEIEKFYATAWKDSWKFAKKHTNLVFRSSMYWALFFALYTAFLVLALFALLKWDLPPVGWIAYVTALIFLSGIYGWWWFLWVEVIKVTMDKKADMGKVPFDFFLVIALGIKFLLWELAAILQFGLMFFTLPVVMSHMAMPITWRGWAMPVMVKIFFKNFKPCMFWWLSAFGASLATLALSAILGVILWLYMGAVVLALANAMEVAVDEGFDLPGNKDEVTVVVASIIIAGMLLIVLLQFAVTAFFGLFMMRVNGLMAKTFTKNLELVTRVKEKKYVSKTALKEKRKQAKIEAKLAKERAKYGDDDEDDDDDY